jgi:hypothetical protein
VSAGLLSARALLLGLGAVMFLVGAIAATTGGAAGAVGGIWLLISGGVLIIAILLERTRYRSELADRSGETPGPGGGEAPDVPMDSRFRRSDEVFEDPTSRRRMRVWIDPVTGERRYRAEG